GQGARADPVPQPSAPRTRRLEHRLSSERETQLDELAWASLPARRRHPRTLHCRTYYAAFTALLTFFSRGERARTSRITGIGATKLRLRPFRALASRRESEAS